MPDGADDRDALIKDLIDESFGLRTKAEQLSQYVESKVAELVKTQMELEALQDGQDRALQRRIKLQRRHDDLTAGKPRTEREANDALAGGYLVAGDDSVN